MRRLAEMLLSKIFLISLLISAKMLTLTAKSFVFAIAFMYNFTSLEGLSPLKVSVCLIGYDD